LNKVYGGDDDGDDDDDDDNAEVHSVSGHVNYSEDVVHMRCLIKFIWGIKGWMC